MSGGNQSASGARPNAEAMSVIECADRERGDDEHERPKAAERDHEAEEEQQVVGAVEDVNEAELDEPQRRLVPARIEPDESRIPRQLERPFDAVRRTEAQRRHHANAQPRQRRFDREVGPIRRDRILEEDVDAGAWFHTIARVWREWRSGDVGERRVVRAQTTRSEGREICVATIWGAAERALPPS